MHTIMHRLITSCIRAYNSIPHHVIWLLHQRHQGPFWYALQKFAQFHQLNHDSSCQLHIHNHDNEHMETYCSLPQSVFLPPQQWQRPPEGVAVHCTALAWQLKPLLGCCQPRCRVLSQSRPDARGWPSQSYLAWYLQSTGTLISPEIKRILSMLQPHALLPCAASFDLCFTGPECTTQKTKTKKKERQKPKTKVKEKESMINVWTKRGHMEVKYKQDQADVWCAMVVRGSTMLKYCSRVGQNRSVSQHVVAAAGLFWNTAASSNT